MSSSKTDEQKMQEFDPFSKPGKPDTPEEIEEKRIADLAFKEKQKMIRKKENEQKQQDKIANIKHNKTAIWENRFEIMEGNPDITFEDFEKVSNLPTLNESIDAWDKIVRKKGKPLVTPKEELPAKKDKLAFRVAQSTNVIPINKNGEIQMRKKNYNPYNPFNTPPGSDTE
jgi:hypothetical protein